MIKEPSARTVGQLANMQDSAGGSRHGLGEQPKLAEYEIGMSKVPTASREAEAAMKLAEALRRAPRVATVRQFRFVALWRSIRRLLSPRF